MSWLSRFSLAQRALIGLMSIVALVFGAIAIPQLKQQLLPTIELPMVVRDRALPGRRRRTWWRSRSSSPSRTASKRSTASRASPPTGAARATPCHGVLRLRPGHPAARRRCPAGRQPGPRPAAGTTSTRRSSRAPPTTLPTVVLAASSGEDQQALADRLDRTVVPALEDIEGVAQVTGGRRPRPPGRRHPGRRRSWPGPASPPRPSSRPCRPAARASRRGSFDEGGANRTVQVGGAFTSVRQIEDLMVTGEGVKKPVRLGDLATVHAEGGTGRTP
ncbi:Hydrogenase expression protein OS=Streptomyces fumanus OX=67302 GN=GCM10018772_00080 PE=4 SV=1 [Streptomyces fumanus]